MRVVVGTDAIVGRKKSGVDALANNGQLVLPIGVGAGQARDHAIGEDVRELEGRAELRMRVPVTRGIPRAPGPARRAPRRRGSCAKQPSMRRSPRMRKRCR